MTYSFYLMEKNAYLDDCLSIVCSASDQTRVANGLTGENIVIFVKFGKKPTVTNRNIDFFNLISNRHFDNKKPILLRVASECLFGIYGDSHCDCEDQRVLSLDAINENGQGIYIHLPQEGLGRGLKYKASELSLQVTGHDASGKYVGEKAAKDAGKYLLGHNEVDIRKYDFLHRIFTDLGLNKFEYVFISDNFRKTSFFTDDLKIKISGHLSVKRKITKHNASWYLEKLYQKSYKLEDNDLLKVIQIVTSDQDLPLRLITLLLNIKKDLETRDFNCNRELLIKLTQAINIAEMVQQQA
jgi:GTP cyclohydrolase II